jgi:WD40 repeat protein
MEHGRPDEPPPPVFASMPLVTYTHSGWGWHPHSIRFSARPAGECGLPVHFLNCTSHTLHLEPNQVFEHGTGKLVHELTGHRNGISCLEMTPKLVSSGSWDATVRVFNRDTGEWDPSATIDRSAPRFAQILTTVCHFLHLDPNHQVSVAPSCRATTSASTASLCRSLRRNWCPALWIVKSRCGILRLAVSGLQTQQLIQIYTNTDYVLFNCLASFCTWNPRHQVSSPPWSGTREV